MPPRIDAGLVDETCGLDEPAFCETFNDSDDDGRAGGLDERTWAFARYGHLASGDAMFHRIHSFTFTDEFGVTPTFCGSAFSDVSPPNDSAICSGTDASGMASNQLHEVLDDAGDFAINSMMIRQLFDFADGGTVVFDVDAKRNEGWDGHGWWVELWITEDPSPMPYHPAPTIDAPPRAGFGIQIAPVGDCWRDGEIVEPPAGYTSNAAARLVVARDHEIERDGVGEYYDCFWARDAELNRFEVRISADRIEVWGSDANTPADMRLLSTFEDVELPMTRGYVHLQHAHYNADKAGGASAQTYRWDNVGFDGPRYAPLRAYDVEDEGSVERAIGDDDRSVTTIGYYLQYNGNPEAHTFTLEGVDTADALAASLNFNLHASPGQVIEYRINGGVWHAYTAPSQLSPELMLRTVSAPVELSELSDGTNTIEMRASTTDDWYTVVGNVDLSLVVSR